MKKRQWILCVIIVFIVGISCYFYIQNKHIFTLSNDVGMIKSEQIQPLFGTIKVSGDCDTDVIFTDVETGKEYIVGYITSGITETIKLEKGKWYTVEARGNIKLRPINVRIE